MSTDEIRQTLRGLLLAVVLGACLIVILPVSRDAGYPNADRCGSLLHHPIDEDYWCSRGMPLRRGQAVEALGLVGALVLAGSSGRRRAIAAALVSGAIALVAGLNAVGVVASPEGLTRAAALPDIGIALCAGYTVLLNVRRARTHRPVPTTAL